MSGARTTDEATSKTIPTRRQSTARKDRKRWCKGKKGREHDYQVQERPNDWGTRGRRCNPASWSADYDWWICKHALICQTCGRQEAISKEQCPEWPS